MFLIARSPTIYNENNDMSFTADYFSFESGFFLFH